MKFPPTSEVRKMRKSLDLTQTQLAAASGISQSTIAKIEKNAISAGYDTVVRLFETMDAMKTDDGKGLTAAEIASKGVVSIQASEHVKAASDLMKSTGFSQIPVLNGELPVGSISEKSILGLLRQGLTMDELSNTTISKVMSDPYPLVAETTPMSTITAMMSVCDAVLVSRKGSVIGIITNADMLKLI